MKDPELKRRARMLYIEHRNIEYVHKQLKRDGYVLAFATLKLWKQKSNGEWDEAGQKYDAEYAQQRAKLKGFESNWMGRLLDLCQEIETRISEGTEKGLSQLVIALTNMIKLIKQLKESQKKIELEENEQVKIVIQEVMNDERVGPVMRERKDDILNRVKKRLELKKK